MKEILTSLFDYKLKKHGLSLAIVFFIMDKLLYLKSDWDSHGLILHHFTNYLVIIGFLTIINSKDKIDDERSIQIRYSVLKTTIGIFSIVFGILALLSQYIGIKQLSLLNILYIIQGLLAFHITLVYLANKYNPSWLFKEKTAPESMNKLLIGCFYSFYGFGILLIIITLLV